MVKNDDEHVRDWAEGIARSNILRLVGPNSNVSAWTAPTDTKSGYRLVLNSLKFDNSVHRDAVDNVMRNILKKGYVHSLTPLEQGVKESPIVIEVDAATFAMIHAAALEKARAY